MPTRRRTRHSRKPRHSRKCRTHSRSHRRCHKARRGGNILGDASNAITGTASTITNEAQGLTDNTLSTIGKVEQEAEKKASGIYDYLKGAIGNVAKGGRRRRHSRKYKK